MTADDWYGRVKALAARGGDLEGAFRLVAGECARLLGPGTTFWAEHGAAGAAPLVHYAVPAARDTALLEAVLARTAGPAMVAPVATGPGAAAVVPLHACAGEMGVLVHLMAAAGPRALPPELLLLTSVFAAQAANHGYVEELSRAKAWIEQELDQVAAIQQALLPDPGHAVPGLTVASRFRAYSHAGGDYFDLVELPPDPGGPGRRGWGVMIADASGHGASAAVEVAMLDAILRTYRGHGGGPAAVFEYANRHFFTRRIRGSFITAFAVNQGPGDDTVTYASAGHNPPLLVRAGGGPVERLEGAGGIPLGVMRDYHWHNSTAAVAPGDLVLLYTDGVVETANRRGSRFGMGRLERVAGAGAGSPEALVAAVEEALDGFREGVRPQDDQTLVAFRIERPAAAQAGQAGRPRAAPASQYAR